MLTMWMVVATVALAGCARKPKPVTARGPREAARPAPRTDAASAPPPASTLRMQGLLRALKGQRPGQVFGFRDLILRHLPELTAEERQDLPAEASVEVFEVTRGHVLLAFVRVTARGHVRCREEQTSLQEVYVLHVKKDERGVERIAIDTSAFSASETKLFESKAPRVVFPRLPPQLAVFELHLDYVPPCFGETARGNLVEVYHLPTATKVGEFATDTLAAVPGQSTRDVARLEWVRGKAPDTAYLVAVALSTGTTFPCTGDPEDRSAACRPQVECQRTVSVVAVTPTLSETVEPEQLELLRRQDPALSKLPRNAEGRTAAACDALEP
jgi:hypothetical protein